MSYRTVYSGGMSLARRRRRRRAAITLTVVAVLLIAVFTYSVAYFQGWVGVAKPAATPTPSCTTTPTVAAIAPAKVTVNVYNATDRNGLAASVATQLRKLGFKVGRIANDPLGRPIDGAGEVRHGDKGAAAAVTVLQRLSTANVVSDGRKDATVDLVLGDGYVKLTTPPKKAAATPAKTPAKPAAKPTTTATPKPGATGTGPAPSTAATAGATPSSSC